MKKECERVMKDYLIKGATIVNHDGELLADVLVKDGIIARINQNIEEEGVQIIDAKGLYLLPGGIDAHTHMEMAFGGTYSSDDYFNGGEAALAGGITSYIDYAIQRGDDTILETLEKRLELVKKEKPRADVFFHVAVTKLNDKILDEFPLLNEHGIHSLKCFMVYKREGMQIAPDDIAKIMLKAKPYGIMINIHAEDVDQIDANIDKFVSEGKLDCYHHYLSRDESVECAGDKIVIDLVRKTGAPAYIVHLANEEGVKLARAAKEEGLPLLVETCPQYLAFTDEVYKDPIKGLDFVCSPPIKGKKSQDELWRAIEDGTIDTVATDHCPFYHEEKLWGKDDFRKIPNGCGGIQYLYTYMLSEAIKRDIPLSRIVSLVSYNPARIFKLKNKGAIEVGKDADLVLFSKDGEHKISKEEDVSRADTNIYEGLSLRGRIVQVYKK